MIQFTKPLILLLLLPVGYYTWRLTRGSLSDMSRFRSRLALVLRLAILAMLVFALAGARIVRNVSQRCVVFVMDVSDSIPKDRQEAARAYINRAIKSMKSEERAGVVVFGGDASVELAPGNVAKVDKIYSVPSTSHTDISQALGLALASFPEQFQKKIVLLSDGNETMGRAAEQAMLAGSDGVSIDVVPISCSLPREVLLDRMVCPSNVKIGEPFDLKVIAVAKRPALARIRILRNNAPAGQKVVDLAAGKSVFTFAQSIPKAGNYEYRAIVETDQDTRPENNSALAYTMVRGKPRVLYVEGQPGQGKYLQRALSSSDMEVDLRDRSGVPTSLAQLRGYDMVVFSDVPAWNLSPDQMLMVKSAVKDLGLGFTMVGGENSFGAGGYYDTPIEETLPVEMSVRKKKILPSLSVVIIMDKSGSMSMPEDGRTKIELANDAAAAVVKLLQPIDQVGVIVCHTYPVAAVNLQPAANKRPIYGEIWTIRAEGGGIVVLPALKMANEMLSPSPTRQKHIIVLADGSDVDDASQECINVITAMASKKITVTTVAFGDGKDVPFLKAAAAAGRGYYYLANRARDLKAIFTKDVMTVSKSLVVEEAFVPRMDRGAPELSDIGSTPPLLGYVCTGAKPAARVSAVSHRNDPILATWQYGLGRSAAFTSDCKARWSARWLGWSEYNKFWAQVVRSTMRKGAPTDFQTTVDISGGEGHVTIDAVDDKGSFINLLKFNASVVGPDNNAHPITIDQTGPGRYEASFDAREVGSYLVNVAHRGEGAPDVNVVNIPYPPEYKDIAPNTSLLRRLAEQTSGRYDPPAGEVFRKDFRSSRAYLDLWRLLALISILLLPLDIAVRRVSMSPEQVVDLYVKLREALRGAVAARRAARARVAVRDDQMETLLKVKKPKRGSAQPAEPKSSDGEGYSPRPTPPAPSTPPAAPKPGSKPAEPKPEGELTSRLLEARRKAKRKGDE